jgi:hypothetical protein
MKNNTAISIAALAFLCACVTTLIGCASMGQDTSVSGTMYITVTCKRENGISKDIVQRLTLIQANSIYIQDGMMEYEVHGVCKSDLTPMNKILELKQELSIVPGVFDFQLEDGSHHPYDLNAGRVLPVRGN